MMKQLLLGYLPTEKDLWEGELAKNRSRYAELKRELLLNPVSAYGLFFCVLNLTPASLQYLSVPKWISNFFKVYFQLFISFH